MEEKLRNLVMLEYLMFLQRNGIEENIEELECWNTDFNLEDIQEIQEKEIVQKPFTMH